jgi:hypothetical protein
VSTVSYPTSTLDLPLPSSYSPSPPRPDNRCLSDSCPVPSLCPYISRPVSPSQWLGPCYPSTSSDVLTPPLESDGRSSLTSTLPTTSLLLERTLRQLSTLSSLPSLKQTEPSLSAGSYLRRQRDRYSRFRRLDLSIERHLHPTRDYR